MNKDVRQKKPIILLPLWIRVPLVFWLLLGVTPILSRTIGIQYFPSPDWVSQVRIPAAVFGFILAVFFTWALAKATMINDQGVGKLTKYGGLLIAPSLAYLIGSSAITMGGPMVGAAVAGAEIEIPFTISRIKQRVDRKCRNSITFDDLPWLYDRLCGSPEEFSRSLKVGDQLFVVGRGTGIGVYARSIRRTD